MTTSAWAFAALALLLATAPATAPVRVVALAGAGRLRAGRPARPGVGIGRPQWLHERVVPLVLVVGVGAAVALTAGPVPAVNATLIAALVARLTADVVLRRRARADHAGVLAAVRILNAELAAGGLAAAALSAASTAAPGVRDVFERAAEQAGRGDPSTVLASDPRPGVRAVGVAWRLGQDTGSALGSVLERVAEDLSAADAQRRAVSVALAGPRSSAVLVALLPVLGLGLGTAMGASPVTVLGGSSAGRLLCLAGVVLDVVGVLWIRAVLLRAERS